MGGGARLALAGVRAVVTDIEGTTTALSFVREHLFGYAAERIGPWLAREAGTPEVAAWLAEVRSSAGLDPAAPPADVAAVLLAWMREDRKDTALKALQGLIWAEGFDRGELQGHVYQDAADALRAWHRAGIVLHVYSSGSVQAQRLLFGHATQGDLAALFSGFHDTTIGSKRSGESYRRILAALGLPGEAVVFLSDVPAELDAAREAGLRTVLVARGALPEDAGSHPVVPSFADLDLQPLSAAPQP